MACKISIIDKESKSPISLVILKTISNCVFVSDNDGTVAFDLPESISGARLGDNSKQKVWFYISSPSYGVQADGFGYEGVRISPHSGDTSIIEVTRLLPARRCGRITGSGLFSESKKIGSHTDWTESHIVGSDSVQCVEYQSKLFWLWGDTNLANYPLGIFHCAGATSSISSLSEQQEPLRIILEYFCDQTGEPRNIARVPGEGPTWIFGLISMRTIDGKEKLGGYYSKIAVGSIDAYETGLVVWNDDSEMFECVLVIWRKLSVLSDAIETPPVSDFLTSATSGPILETAEGPSQEPTGQAFQWIDSSGQGWYMFGHTFPSMRCPANFEAWLDTATWESLEPQQPLYDAHDRVVLPHRCSLSYHPWRARWTVIFTEKDGVSLSGRPSALGEIWYAESDSPLGPWGTAVKVLSHENYSFYNPRQHDHWASVESPNLYFEGTYTVLWTNPPALATPRYEYNQILYCVSLDDPQLEPARRPATMP